MLQQKMGDCPPSSVLSCVPGYGGERTSPHSSVAQGEGVVQRKIKIGALNQEQIRKEFQDFLKAREANWSPSNPRLELFMKIFEKWMTDNESRSFDSITKLFWNICIEVEPGKKQGYGQEIEEEEGIESKYDQESYTGNSIEREEVQRDFMKLLKNDKLDDEIKKRIWEVFQKKFNLDSKVLFLSVPVLEVYKEIRNSVLENEKMEFSIFTNKEMREKYGSLLKEFADYLENDKMSQEMQEIGIDAGQVMHFLERLCFKDKAILSASYQNIYEHICAKILKVRKLHEFAVPEMGKKAGGKGIKTKFAKFLKSKEIENDLNEFRITINEVWDVFVGRFHEWRNYSSENMEKLYVAIRNKIKEGREEEQKHKNDKADGMKCADGIYPLRYIPENHTRLGFEIELAKHYCFPLEKEQEIKALNNETLATFYLDKDIVENKSAVGESGKYCSILDMLIDDVKVEKGFVDAQIEFRSVPLEFKHYHSKMGMGIDAAIKGFCDSMLNTEGSALEVYSEKKAIGYWIVKKKLPSLPCYVKNGHVFDISTVPEVQHVTISIEPEAFLKISSECREMLVPYLKEGKDIQELFNKMQKCVGSITKSLRDDNNKRGGGSRKAISATTGGRNELVICFKTPLEAIKAAFKSLGKIQIIDEFSEVTVENEDYTYKFRDAQDVSKEIINTGIFPKIQGEDRIGGGEVFDSRDYTEKKIKPNGYKWQEEIFRDRKWLNWKKKKRIGYRVIAEKLQPLLLDRKSGIPRILFEHRGKNSSLPHAVNRALYKDNVELQKFRQAAKAMDDARKPILGGGEVNKDSDIQFVKGSSGLLRMIIDGKGKDFILQSFENERQKSKKIRELPDMQPAEVKKKSKKMTEVGKAGKTAGVKKESKKDKDSAEDKKFGKGQLKK